MRELMLSLIDETEIALPPDSGVAHACPVCDSVLRERLNKKTGQTFFGCARWPECDWTDAKEMIRLSRSVGYKIGLVDHGQCRHCGGGLPGVSSFQSPHGFWLHEHPVLAPSFVTRINGWAVAERDGWICQLCGLPINRAQRHPEPLALVVDHIVPVAAGGRSIPENLQAVHSRCNGIKGTWSGTGAELGQWISARRLELEEWDRQREESRRAWRDRQSHN